MFVSGGISSEGPGIDSSSVYESRERNGGSCVGVLPISVRGYILSHWPSAPAPWPAPSDIGGSGGTNSARTHRAESLLQVSLSVSHSHSALISTLKQVRAGHTSCCSTKQKILHLLSPARGGRRTRTVGDVATRVLRVFRSRTRLHLSASRFFRSEIKQDVHVPARP